MYRLFDFYLLHPKTWFSGLRLRYLLFKETALLKTPHAEEAKVLGVGLVQSSVTRCFRFDLAFLYIFYFKLWQRYTILIFKLNKASTVQTSG